MPYFDLVVKFEGRMGMAWWVWVLIVLGVAGIGVAKMTVFNRWMARRKEALKRSSED